MDPLQALLQLRVSNFVVSIFVAFVPLAVSDVKGDSTSSKMAYAVLLSDVIAFLCYLIACLLDVSQLPNSWLLYCIGFFIGLIGESMSLLLYRKRLQLTEVSTTTFSRIFGIFFTAIPILTSFLSRVFLTIFFKEGTSFPMNDSGLLVATFMFTLTKILIYVFDMFIVYQTLLLLRSDVGRGVSILEALKGRTIKMNLISFILNVVMIIVRFTIFDPNMADFSINNYAYMFEHLINCLFFLVKLDNKPATAGEKAALATANLSTSNRGIRL